MTHLKANRPLWHIADLCVLSVDGELRHFLLFLLVTNFYYQTLLALAYCLSVPAPRPTKQLGDP
jgi:hypothetical protein